MGYDVSDDKYAYTAVRAETHDQATRSRNVLPALSAPVLHRHRRIAQFNLQGGQCLAVAGGEDVVEADVDEAVRKDVLGVAPHELHPVKGHGLFLAAVAVVLVLLLQITKNI